MFRAVLPLTSGQQLSGPSIRTSIWKAIWSHRRTRAVAIILMSASLALFILLTSTTPHADPPSSDITPVQTGSKDAYVLFLPTSSMEQWYLRSALVMIFALTTDPQFKDPAGRDVVVLTSNMTSSEDIAELQAAGAKIHPIPYLIDGLFPDVSHTFPRYKYTFNKLWVWDLVQYDRVLFMDADMIFTRPLADVWIDPHAWPRSGLAATADLGAQLDGTYFNSGFMMVRPDRAVFEELKKVELDDVFYPDQNLLNKYYSRQGDKPWEPLNRHFQALHPTAKDIADGAYTLQEKGWSKDTPFEVGNIWWTWYGRMLGWQEAKADQTRMTAEAQEISVLRRVKAWV